jgi:hypothetical protein
MTDTPTRRDSKARARSTDSRESHTHSKKRRHGDSIPSLGGNDVAGTFFHRNGGSRGLANQPQLSLGHNVADRSFGKC